MSRKQASSETCKKPFAFRLSAVMDERGITQKQLAAVIGKKPQTVSLYRLGQSEPDASTILVIAEYLNVTVDWLIGRDNAPIVYGSTVSEAATALGLTDEAASKLKRITGVGADAKSALDELIKSPHFMQIASLVLNYIKRVQKLISLSNDPASETSDLMQAKNSYDLLEYYANKELGSFFSEIEKREIGKSTSLIMEKDGTMTWDRKGRRDSNAEH